MQTTIPQVKPYLLASDFDQTLSFNDSGLVLSELAGIPSDVFEAKVATLAVQNLVQQGGELSYLLLHDPQYRASVRREHLVQAGKGVRLKKNIRQLSELLAKAIPGYRFDFHVISAAPQEVIESALEDIVSPITSTAHNCSTTAPGRWKALSGSTPDTGRWPCWTICK